MSEELDSKNLPVGIYEIKNETDPSNSIFEVRYFHGNRMHYRRFESKKYGSRAQTLACAKRFSLTLNYFSLCAADRLSEALRKS